MGLLNARTHDTASRNGVGSMIIVRDDLLDEIRRIVREELQAAAAKLATANSTPTSKMGGFIGYVWRGLRMFGHKKLKGVK